MEGKNSVIASVAAFIKFNGRCIVAPLMQRSAGDLDDEALKLTKDVLSLNPEISTFWSYRREILEEKKKSL